jgi:ABC-type uncharacterized transport system ATPase subunit
MSEELEVLIDILEESLKKNGDKPITISHLLNIMKMTERVALKRAAMDDRMYSDDGQW